MKTCSQCRGEKPLSDFVKRSSAPDGRSPWCKPCASVKAKQYYERRGRHVRDAKLYGLSPEEVAELRSRPCELCGRTNLKGANSNIDHCHETGRVRGHLCNKCNTGLGAFHDSPDELIAAAMWLLSKEATMRVDPDQTVTFK